MPVDSRHKHYMENIDDWQMSRDAVSGQRAIHRKGESYLNRLGAHQDDREYLEYRDRALFLGAAGRTVDGLQGLVFRKAPSVSLPKSMDEWQLNVTGEGHTLIGVASWMISELLTTGRGGLLVDMPRVDTSGLSRAQVEALRLTPFIRTYNAESIINWKIGQLPDGSFGATMVVLRETYDELLESDEFDTEERIQYRVLDIVEGVYRMRLFRQESSGSGSGAKANWVVVEEAFPMIDGQNMTFIPFQFFGADSNTYEVSKSPLVDLVNLNIGHYRTSADYYSALHLVGLPTVVISGIDPDGDEMPTSIGPRAIWAFSDSGTKADFLQVDASNFSVISDSLRDLEAQMASMGARMLSPEKAAAESGHALSIKSRGEQSVLAMVSAHASMALSWAVALSARWLAVDDSEAYIELNKDFMAERMTAQDLTALMGAWQSGAISKLSLFEALKRGEVISEDRSFEEEEDMIEAEGGGLDDSLGLVGRSEVDESEPEAQLDEDDMEEVDQ